MKLATLIFLLALFGSATAQEDTITVFSGQVLLDRAHFSVGEIDGIMGSTTAAAIRHFQAARGLQVTGSFDEPTLEALEDGEPYLTDHTLTAADVAGPFGPAPKYANVAEKLGELFQVSPTMLRKLNRDTPFYEGETLKVPLLGGPLGKIAKLVITKGDKSLKAYDSTGKLLAYYPTTLGAIEAVPYGQHRVVSTTMNPYYRRVLRDTGEVREMNGGPNNFVGDIWMALSAKHYGIHGSPMPDRIAKQESAGCIRLTNWDAHEVAASIVKNVTVIVQR